VQSNRAQTLVPSSSHAVERPCARVEPLLQDLNSEKKVVLFRKKQKIYTQGDPADSVYYIQDGTVKIAVVSPQGKEAVVSILGPGTFFGEACLMSRPRQVNTATAVTNCALVRLTKPCMAEALHQGKFSELFLVHLVSRNQEYEQAICEHIVEGSEKRLARVLLRLSRCGQQAGTMVVIPRLSHETLADMTGTTRPRVSVFMNKFRKLGLIDYKEEMRVNRARLEAVILSAR
jgi:CRP/FNR family cyclic AMP-dependent transcriptional regulator